MKKNIFLLLIAFIFLLTGCTKKDNDIKELPDGLLFEHGQLGYNQFYNYAPSIFQEDENTRFIYYCANEIEGNVTDHIAFRKGIKQNNGVYIYGDIQYVLKSTEGTWDERHTCDPDVVKGNFKYQGDNYYYLMAYLGCTTSNNQENEVGLAVAKSPEGPWIKTNNINPIAKYTRNTSNDINDKFQWGYGQPSLINIDKDSTILLFYTYGDGLTTGTIVEKWNFADIDNPIKVDTKIVTSKGLKNLNGSDDIINNADFAYDSVKRRIYGVSENHPYPESYPNNISASNKVIFIGDIPQNPSYLPGDILFNPEGRSWTETARVDKNLTSFDRNHNSTILTDEYGWLIDSESIDIVYSVSVETGSFWGALSTYRIHQVNIKITE